MEAIREKTLPQMQHECKELLDKFLFVSDYMQVSPIVSKLQAQAIQWANRMPYIMEEHLKIIASKEGDLREALKVGVSFLPIVFSTIVQTKLIKLV